MQAANGGATGPKKIDYHLKPKILGKEFTTSEMRTWCSGMIFWAAQLMETRDEEVRWANFFDCMHTTLKDYYKPRMPRGIGICNPPNVADVLADHRTALEILQRDHETKWPIHNRRVNLFQARAEGGPVLRPMAHPPIQPQQERKGGRAHRQRLASLPPHPKL
jgi:hypothetical protein